MLTEPMSDKRLALARRAAGLSGEYTSTLMRELLAEVERLRRDLGSQQEQRGMTDRRSLQALSHAGLIEPTLPSARATRGGWVLSGGGDSSVADALAVRDALADAEPRGDLQPHTLRITGSGTYE